MSYCEGLFLLSLLVADACIPHPTPMPVDISSFRVVWPGLVLEANNGHELRLHVQDSQGLLIASEALGLV